MENRKPLRRQEENIYPMVSVCVFHVSVCVSILSRRGAPRLYSAVFLTFRILLVFNNVSKKYLKVSKKYLKVSNMFLICF